MRLASPPRRWTGSPLETQRTSTGDSPSVPIPTAPSSRISSQQGVVTHDELLHFNKPSQAWRDRIYTRAAIDIIQKHHPDLLLLHLLALDGIEHQTGYGNDAGRDTIAFLDDRVKDVVDAVRAAGDFDRTTFLIVSDHGQQSVHQQLHPNVLLKQAGLQGASVTSPVFCMPDGGFALVFQQHATEASRAKLKSLFSGKPGIRAALTPDEAAKEGWPTPAQTDQAPDLLLYAADGYSFSGGDTGNFVTDTKEVGSHGYPNTVPLMQAIFIAAGSGIQAKGEIPAFPNLDIAPTIAHLLHISLGNIQGKPLTADIEVAQFFGSQLPIRTRSRFPWGIQFDACKDGRPIHRKHAMNEASEEL